MEKTSSLTLARTSDQKIETVVAAFKSPPSAASGGVPKRNGILSGNSSQRAISPSSGRNGSNKSTHLRMSRSAPLTKVELDDVTCGAALSRASSASVDFPLSLSGFTEPPKEIADLKPSSCDEISEDIEAGTDRSKIQIELTLPIHLKFKDVTYKVLLKGLTTSHEKSILTGITGSVNPGEFLAIMGPSGSGKTTLLHLLGGRIQQATVSGLITYNDQPYSKQLKSRIGFVTQDDVLFPHLTVKETLTYAALLRLSKTLSKEEKKKRAMDVIYELGLERCQDTMIGGSFIRGVSGGERKRVSIGNEILINPSLLFLDEPTSGLDSTTALRTVQILQDIAEAGKTVITTIHQPSSRLFYKFDKLIMLGKGSLLYFGKASKAMDYFSSIGCSPLIAMNPAEFLLDLANGNVNDMSIPSDKMQMKNGEAQTRYGKPSPGRVHDYLVGAYKKQVAENEKKNLMAILPLGKELESFPTKRQWGASWWDQYSVLFYRGIKERRHEYFSWLRITQVLAMAIILGLLWWDSDFSTLEGLENQEGLLFIIVIIWGFLPAFTAIFTFPQERAMLNKERAADMYKLSAYFMARTTSDLPLDLILPVIFLVIVYFMTGLRLHASYFFFTLLTIFLCIIASQGLGLAIGAALMDTKKASTLTSVTIITFFLAGGFFVKNVPIFVSWIRYLSFHYHTYKILLYVHYQDIAPTVDGMAIESSHKEVCALLIMVVGYRLLAYISLRRMKQKS